MTTKTTLVTIAISLAIVVGVVGSLVFAPEMLILAAAGGFIGWVWSW